MRDGTAPAQRRLPAPRPAARWLWAATLVVVVVFTIARIVVFSSLDLRTDEAYYWTWSQESAASFLDQPPMVAYFVRLGTLIFGDTPFGARFGQFLAIPLIELVFADMARRRTGSMSAALLVVLAIESTVNFGVTGVIIEPGIPLILFAGLMFWSLCRLDETDDPRWWLAVGVFGGLGLLSKYIVVFFLPAVIVYVLGTARTRRWLRSGWFWAAGLVALALFVPVLAWNARHDWASFRFQGVRLTSTPSLSWSTFGDYFATNAAFNGPLLMLAVLTAMAASTPRLLQRGDAFGLAIVVAFVAPFLYLAARSLGLSVNPSWAIVMWPFGITALAIAAYPTGGRPTRWARLFAGIGVVTGLPIAGALLYHGAFPSGIWLGNRDPVGADAGYEEVADQVLATARAHNVTWISTSDYRTYAALRWHLFRVIPVVEVVERSRFIDFTPPAMTLIAGHPGLYVHPGNSDPRIEDATKGHIQPLGTLDRTWRGAVMGTLKLDLVDGWTPPLDAGPGSPFYAWPDLG